MKYMALRDISDQGITRRSLLKAAAAGAAALSLDLCSAVVHPL